MRTVYVVLAQHTHIRFGQGRLEVVGVYDCPADADDAVEALHEDDKENGDGESLVIARVVPTEHHPKLPD